MFVCPVCNRDVNNSCKSILCDCCNLWVHQSRRSGLNSSQFNLIGKDSNPWFCPNCINSILPFPFDSSAEGVQLCDEPRPILLPHGNRLNDNIIPLIHSLNKVSFNVDFDDNAESLNSSNCNYYECKDFNTAMSSTHCHNISSFHLNISSISKHFDELSSLLSLLQCNFSFIGISETRLMKDREPVLDFSLPGYSNVSTPTEYSAGGVLLYISNSFAFKPRLLFLSCEIS